MIANAQRTVAETEEVGLEITTELQRNREKIQSAHSKVGYALYNVMHAVTVMLSHAPCTPPRMADRIRNALCRSRIARYYIVYV
jgi:Snare region anchored in the vesicle membrane C-terminus